MINIHSMPIFGVLRNSIHNTQTHINVTRCKLIEQINTKTSYSNIRSELSVISLSNSSDSKFCNVFDFKHQLFVNSVVIANGIHKISLK